MEHDDEDFCFRRLTITGQVTRLFIKDCIEGQCLLYFLLTVKRSNKPDKELSVSGEIFGSQVAIAKWIETGSIVKLVGCLKEPDLAATMLQLPRLDLEQLLEVQP